jgi:two-component system chemotaxis response regulator CheY
MSPDSFLTTEEVLEYLQVNLRTVYRLVKAGKIPAVRVGRQWRFRKADIDAYLASSRSADAKRTPGPSRVLVVDDQEAIRKVIAHALTGAGYEVEVAADGASAIERLRAREYDLLVTDLSMPGMGGLAVIREARRLLGLSLPVVIITGHSTEASAIEAINLGVSGYLLKPFRPPQIVRVAARVLGEPVPATET